MKKSQIKKFEKFFEDRLPEMMADREVLDILFLVLGEKPGALVMDADRETIKVLEEFCTEFSAEMKVVEEKKKSLLDEICGEDTCFMKDSIFLAHGRERFEILEESEGRFCGFSDRAVGKFLGYPKSAIDYYVDKIKEEPAGQEVDKRIEEMLQEGNISEDARECLEMLSYLPAPREENIRKAVEEGKKRRSIVEELEVLDQLN